VGSVIAAPASPLNNPITISRSKPPTSMTIMPMLTQVDCRKPTMLIAVQTLSSAKAVRGAGSSRNTLRYPAKANDTVAEVAAALSAMRKPARKEIRGALGNAAFRNWYSAPALGSMETSSA